MSLESIREQINEARRYPWTHPTAARSLVDEAAKGLRKIRDHDAATLVKLAEDGSKWMIVDPEFADSCLSVISFKLLLAAEGGKDRPTPPEPEPKPESQSSMKNSEIQTRSGIFFDPFHPTPEQINIWDIAHALSLQCRFSGHTKWHWSVAAHSLLCADLAPDRLKGYALLHDASEAYLSDVASPIKQRDSLAEYRAAEKRIQECILTRYGLSPLSDKDASTLHEIDLAALHTEATDLMHGTGEWPDQESIRKLQHRVSLKLREKYLASELAPRLVRTAFLNAFERHFCHIYVESV